MRLTLWKLLAYETRTEDASDVALSQRQTSAWLFGAVIMPALTSLVVSTWPNHEFAWGAGTALLVLLVFYAPSDGLLRRHREGRARWVRLLAVASALAYAIVLATWSDGTSLLGTLLPASCLWLTSSLLMFTSTNVPFASAAGNAALALLAVLTIINSIDDLNVGEPTFAILGFLVGAGLLLLAARGTPTSVARLGFATLLLSAPVFYFSIDELRFGSLFAGSVILVIALAIASVGLSFGRSFFSVMSGTMMLLLGTAFVYVGLLGMTSSADWSDSFHGATFLLFGIAGVLIGLSLIPYAVRRKAVLRGVAALLSGIALTLLSVGAIMEGQPVEGAAAILFMGVAAIISAIAVLHRRTWSLARSSVRLRAYLTAKPEGPSHLSDDSAPQRPPSAP